MRLHPSSTTTVDPDPSPPKQSIGTRLKSWLRARLGRRVQVIRQMTVYECGAASLGMILNYFGRETTLRECREMLDAGRDGTSVSGIARCARDLGLVVRHFSVTLARLPEIPMPAILFWNFSHFLVLESWRGKYGIVADPATGRRRVDAAEFSRMFTGVLMAFEPGPNFQPRRLPWDPNRLSFVRALRLRDFTPYLVKVLVLSLVCQSAGLLVPLATKLVVDTFIPQQIVGLNLILGLGLAVALLGWLVSTLLRSQVLNYLNAQLDGRIMDVLARHLLSLPLSFFTRRPPGDLVSRLNSNSVVRELFTGRSLSFVIDGAFTVIYFGVLFASSAMFGAIALVMSVVQVGVIILTNPRVQHHIHEHLISFGEWNNSMGEALAGIESIKASGVENRMVAKGAQQLQRFLNSSYARNDLNSRIESAGTLCRTLTPILILWMGFMEVQSGAMSLGTLLGLIGVTTAMMGPLASLAAMAGKIQTAGAHVKRLLDILETEPEQHGRALGPCDEVSGQLELRNVSFRFTRNGPLILKDVSLTIQPGQKVAIVGRSGCGKSTLGSLLVALYEPSEGSILLDGRPLAQLPYQEVRKRFGVVLQEPHVFTGTIYENITLGDTQISSSAVARAARMSCLDEVISTMPMEYETYLAGAGKSLSGGQKQRLGIARALARSPKIMLFDEATSHLDTITEARMEQNLAALACTRVVIAHRMSTVRDADLIVVVHEGRIVEQGTHAELCRLGGHYATLTDATPPPAQAVQESSTQATV